MLHTTSYLQPGDGSEAASGQDPSSRADARGQYRARRALHAAPNSSAQGDAGPISRGPDSTLRPGPLTDQPGVTPRRAGSFFCLRDTTLCGKARRDGRGERGMRELSARTGGFPCWCVSFGLLVRIAAAISQFVLGANSVPGASGGVGWW